MWFQRWGGGSKSIRACKYINKWNKSASITASLWRFALQNSRTCTECRCSAMPSACNYSSLPLIAPCRACCRPQTSHLSSATLRSSVSHSNLFHLCLLCGVREGGNTWRMVGWGGCGGGAGDKITKPVSLSNNGRMCNYAFVDIGWAYLYTSLRNFWSRTCYSHMMTLLVTRWSQIRPAI